jgi:hypothetical protein
MVRPVLRILKRGLKPSLNKAQMFTEYELLDNPSGPRPRLKESGSVGFALVLRAYNVGNK